MHYLLGSEILAFLLRAPQNQHSTDVLPGIVSETFFEYIISLEINPSIAVVEKKERKRERKKEDISVAVEHH